MRITRRQLRKIINEELGSLAISHRQRKQHDRAGYASGVYEDDDPMNEAEYQGKKVKLNKPRRIRKGEPGYGKSQMVVFVNDGDRVKRVAFGDPKSRIKKSNPKRRKSFRDRHNCDNPGPKTKARYWSCKAW